MADSKQDKLDKQNQEEVARSNTPDKPEGSVPASDLPDPNPHVAGQTPAGETDQPDFMPANEVATALGEAQRALSNIHYDQSVPASSPESLDPVIDKLEAALKAAKAHKSSAAKKDR